MQFGRPPFAALNTIQKLTSIPNPKSVIIIIIIEQTTITKIRFQIQYPSSEDPDAIETIRSCLVVIVVTITNNNNNNNNRCMTQRDEQKYLDWGDCSI